MVTEGDEMLPLPSMKMLHPSLSVSHSVRLIAGTLAGRQEVSHSYLLPLLTCFGGRRDEEGVPFPIKKKF